MATVFVGGSALLLAGAMAALAFGFVREEESLVITALVASIAAAIFLVIAYFVSKRDLKRAAARREAGTDATTTPAANPRPEEAVGDSEQSEVKLLAPGPSTTGAREDRGSAAQSAPEKEEGNVAGAPAAASLAGATPTTKPSTAKKSSAPGTAAIAKPSSPEDTVVGIGTKKKFHRPDCRYAKSESGEEMTRATARKRGYVPCGICKP